MAMTNAERKEYFQFAWMAQGYSDALIEIAASFGNYVLAGGGSFCLHCRCHMQNDCQADCPGLRARRALEIA